MVSRFRPQVLPHTALQCLHHGGGYITSARRSFHLELGRPYFKGSVYIRLFFSLGGWGTNIMYIHYIYIYIFFYVYTHIYIYIEYIYIYRNTKLSICPLKELCITEFKYLYIPNKDLGIKQYIPLIFIHVQCLNTNHLVPPYALYMCLFSSCD